MLPELFEVNNAKYRLDFELSVLMMLMPHTPRWQSAYESQVARVRTARREYLSACSVHNSALVAASVVSSPAV
jgi:hypothetical protein